LAVSPGSFLVGDSTACALFDRQQATIEVSREHSDYFIRNIAAILCELRVSFAVFNSAAFISGTFPS
jgi:HK97 family phage major capsid protein